MLLLFKLFSLILIVTIFSDDASAEKSLAMITELNGEVLLTASQDEVKEALILDTLAKGDRLTLQGGASLELCFYSNATIYNIQGKGEFVISDKGVGKLSDQLRISEYSVSMVYETGLKPNDSLVQGGLILRSGAKKNIPLQLVYPVDTIILEQQPDFGWSSKVPIKGKINIYRQDGKLISSQKIDSDAKSFSLQVVLERGTTYFWEFIPLESQSQFHTQSAEFLVATSALFELVMAVKPSDADSFSKRTLFGQFLEEQGLTYEAKKIWKALSEQKMGSTSLRLLSE